ncbi:MAG: hypothetical protein EB140_06845 [Proteobacteria bacterium]|nr:hypothetical protein [Pseudomonadota bacterium]
MRLRKNPVVQVRAWAFELPTVACGARPATTASRVSDWPRPTREETMRASTEAKPGRFPATEPNPLLGEPVASPLAVADCTPPGPTPEAPRTPETACNARADSALPPNPESARLSWAAEAPLPNDGTDLPIFAPFRMHGNRDASGATACRNQPTISQDDLAGLRPTHLSLSAWFAPTTYGDQNRSTRNPGHAGIAPE